jgi:nucleoside-diphosphate-sugar epimerase/SAM-dependent methyltransferase
MNNLNADTPITLVTGATGFTGSHLVRSLVADGERVRVIVRSSARAREVLPPAVEFLEGDLAAPATAARAMRGVRTVYHLAAVYREARHDAAEYQRVNVEASRLLLDAAVACGVGRFVHCSTVGVLGHIATPPGDERTAYSPGDVYQVSKYQGERLALSYRDRLPLAVARPTAIYGPGDTRLLKMFRMVARRRFPLLGGGENYYHMVYVDDLVRGLRLLGTHPAAAGEMFILGGERYLKLRELTALIAEAAGVPAPRLRLPARPFQIAGTICEQLCVPLGIEPPIHRRRIDFYTKSRAFSIEKASRLLGYRPEVDLEQGIRKTLDWYVAQGYIELDRSATTVRSADRSRQRAPTTGGPKEEADVETSTPQYATRFEGPVGRWFVGLQTRITRNCLAGLGPGATILDVGGGHAQVAAPLVEAGYDVTVVGSSPSCGKLLAPLTSTGRCRFEVADLQALPYASGAFDAVICYRLLAHTADWRRLISELCRVARQRVIVDYPSLRSVNIVSGSLFDLKRSVEGGTTRPFALYRPHEMARAFADAGFVVTDQQPQFLLPMALYRLAGSVRLARAAEDLGRALRLTQWLGSPVIDRADRMGAQDRRP